jgi:pimeloyl-ACP methyl ester carboxylesterase
MVAQVMALKRPTLLRRIILTGTGPEGGVGVAMDRPELLKTFVDQKMSPSDKLLKLFFESTETSQSAGRKFVQRLGRRTEDKDAAAGAEAAGAQLKAMAAWARAGGEPHADLTKITQPVLVTNGEQRHYDPDGQLDHTQRASAQCAAHHLPRLRSRVVVSAC